MDVRKAILQRELFEIEVKMEGAKMLGDWSTYFELKEISDGLSALG